MKSLKKMLAVSLLCLGSSTAAIACTEPQAPLLPDPESAVTPQMVKAKNDVKVFLSEAEAFLDCNKSSKKHNKMVDQMNDIANQFNEIVRAYKSKMAG